VQAQKKPHSPQSYQIKPCSLTICQKNSTCILASSTKSHKLQENFNSYKTTKNTLVSMGVLKMFVLEALASDI